MDNSFKIECPKCGWEPGPDALWGCSCGHMWHTFDTGGRCPNCHRQWEDTQCHSPEVGGCTRWSPHLDWYKGLDEALRLALEELRKRVEEKVS